jgi:muramoyltetrapeptide carboxypeptidase
MYSTRLQAGDEIRVIAPSGCWKKQRLGDYKRAQVALERMGYRVSFGRNIRAVERFQTGSTADRLQDFHEAYLDSNVRLVMALHGGWSANALLPGIDWALVAANPKPFIGFSDLTVLVNALYATTGAPQYLGPTFASLGSPAVQSYTCDALQAVVAGSAPFALRRSLQWQKTYGGTLTATKPWDIVQSGVGEGVIIGGNLGSFYLLQGTPYQPQFDQPYILTVEDDDESGVYGAREFDRRLESLLQLPGAREQLRGLLIGRFQLKGKVTLPDVAAIVARLQLGTVPVLAGVDFGHTLPMATVPVGGRARVVAQNKQRSINLVEW